MHTATLLFLLTLPILAKELPTRSLPVAEPAEFGMSVEGLAKIAPTVDQLIAGQKLAGASVHILRKGHIVYCRQFGHRDISADAAMAEDTIFRE